MSNVDTTIPQSNNRIVRISRDHYEQIIAERDAALREVASLRALIQADGTVSKVALGLGEASHALAKGLNRLATPQQSSRGSANAPTPDK